MLPNVAKNYQKLPKVGNSYHILPKVIKSCQKIPKFGNSYQKLETFINSWQKLPKVTKTKNKSYQKLKISIKFFFGTVCLQTVLINSNNYWFTIFPFFTAKSIQLMFGDNFHEYGIKPLHKCKMRPYINVRWDLTWM